MYNYLISVIIPVYNCEKYLKKSIDSLLSQTIFEKIEFIFVNDGSTDNSELIINSYVKQYSNIKLITKVNGGVSSARNTGIINSTGKFLSFFDADDIANPNLYEVLYKLLEKSKADISVVDYCMVFPNGFEKKHRNQSTKLLYGKNIILKSFFSDNIICNNPVDKMFRRKTIENVSFPEGYAIGEDMFFVYKALCNTDSLIIDSTKVLYKYCLHSESAMKSDFSDKYFDSVYLAKKIMDEFEYKSELYNYAEANYIHEICKMFSLLYKKTPDQIYVNKTEIWSNTLKQYKLSKAIKFMDKKHVFALILMKVSPKLYNFVYRLMKIG